MQQKLRVLAASVAAVAFASLITTGSGVASAEENAPADFGLRASGVLPGKAAAGGIGVQSSSSGANSADFTGDGKLDILARQADNGVLKVYPHSGSFNGTNTFQPAVNINFGWGGFRWIGTGFVNADQKPDVIGIDGDGTMRVYPHSGAFNGTSTLTSSTVLGYGWNINDLVLFGDFTGDGFSDIVARRTGGNIAYLYQHNGALAGTSTYSSAVPLINGVANTVEMNMADVTKDGFPDIVFLEPASTLGVFSFMDGPTDPETGFPTGWSWVLGYGWNIMNAVTLSEVNGDGLVDVLGRRQNGDLYAYPHSGTWDPNNSTATLTSPTYLGAGWNTNNVIS
jgi:hypothetical protein